MKIGAVAHAALFSLISIYHGVEGQRHSNYNINKQLMKNLEKNKIHIAGHVSVKLATTKDGKLGLPQANQLVLPTIHALETPLDHTGKFGEKFNQTFWVYDKYYKPGGPVFLYHGGENDMTESAGIWLNGTKLDEYQKEFGGLGVVLQHRYYGPSTPRYAWGTGSNQIDISTATEKFQYLTTEQALEDVKFLADHFNHTSPRVPKNIDLTPKGTPWIIFGASYSGNLVSFLRRKYPDTFFAAYSSSAPVEARRDMPMYWNVLAKAVGIRHPACVKNMRSAINYIDRELGKGGKHRNAVKRLFLGPGGEENSNGWFVDTLQNQFFVFQFGGMDTPIVDGTNFTISNFCDHMNNDGGIKSPTEGWEMSKYPNLRRSGDWTAQRWATWPGYAANLRDKGYKCGGNSANASPDEKYTCDLSWPWLSAVDIPWKWQFCSEWGYFLVGNPGPNQIVSNFSNTEHWKTKCKENFNDATAGKFLPMNVSPKVNDTNKIFGGWSDPQPRTFYIAGEQDPWGSLGFLKTDLLINEKDSPKYFATMGIPACDAKQSGENIFGYVVPDGLHCEDLMNSEKATTPYNIFRAALKVWLPCWRSATGGQYQGYIGDTSINGIRLGIPANKKVTIKVPVTELNQTKHLNLTLGSVAKSSRHDLEVNDTLNEIALERALKRRVYLWSN